MSQTATRHRTSDAERYQAVTAARERFLAGDDRVRGVRPEVATSWYRCREQYHVDPSLSKAPPASAQDESSAEHTLEHEIVFAQLGGAATSIATEVESVGGVVAVTDGAGRILTVQGDRETLARARDILRQRARDGGAERAAAFTQTRARSGQALAALDASGKVVIADEGASLFLGVPTRVPALDPAVRWKPGLDLGRLARHAIKQARHDHGWVGSTQILTELSSEPCRITLRPVFFADQPIGTLVVFGSEHGDQIEHERPRPALSPPPRIVGVSGERMVLLRPGEVRFAEADGNDVWLVTEEGRLQAAVHGIDKLEEELAEGEFLRVHRRFIVNLSCVRAVDRGARGELSLIMDGGASEAVPVSRRNLAAVRRALGL